MTTARPVKNRVTEMTGTDYPIIQAPMGWIARAQLASAVSNAGGICDENGYGFSQPTIASRPACTAHGAY